MASGVTQKLPVYLYNSEMVDPRFSRDAMYFATNPACLTAMETALKGYGASQADINILRSPDELIKAAKAADFPLSIILPGGNTASLLFSLFERVVWKDGIYKPETEKGKQIAKLLKNSNVLGSCAGGHVLSYINDIPLSSHPFFETTRAHDPDKDSKAVIINIKNSDEFPTLRKISQCLTYWNGGLGFTESPYSTTNYVFHKKARTPDQSEGASFAAQRDACVNVGVSFHPEIPVTMSSDYKEEEIPLGMNPKWNDLVNQGILSDLFARINIQGDPKIKKNLSDTLKTASDYINTYSNQLLVKSLPIPTRPWQMPSM